MIAPPAGQARAARADEAEAVLQTLSAAFGLNPDLARPIFAADPFYDLSYKRVLALPSAGIVSCLTVVPQRLHVGGASLPSAGIGSVATRPAFQKQGHAGALLAATVPALWSELGYPVSLLFPASASSTALYRRFGWKTASETLQWTGVPAALPRSPDAAPIRPAREGDWPAIVSLHAEQTAGETGACIRDPRRWALIRLPVPNRETFVYDAGGEVAGYSIWERGEILRVGEMHARTPEARRGLLGFLALQPEPKIEWPASAAGLSRFGLSASEARSCPGAMLRIVDLTAALSAVHASVYGPVIAREKQPLTLHIDDPLCSANTSPCRLTAAGVCAGDAYDPAWLRTDIGTLAALFLGHVLPTEAALSGLLNVDSYQTLALADRVFPRQSPFVAPLDEI